METFDAARVALFLLALTVSSPLAATADSRSDWTAFRERTPFHAQHIALGDAAPDGRRSLVIAEPPPWVDLSSFIDAFRDRISDVEVMQHRVGVDGWVKDIVGVVQFRDDAELDALVRDLSRFLWGTSYKAYAVNLHSGAERTGTYDVSVSSFALRKWLGVQPEQRSAAAGAVHGIAWIVGALAGIILLRTRRAWALTTLTSAILVVFLTWERTPVSQAGALRPLHGGEPAALKTLLERPATGVFLTEQPGLVALVLARDRRLNDSAIALREFAVDSDLILGAFGSASAVVLFGRERQVPVTALPPLRTETMLQLAAVGSDELAQSYERLNLFAGATSSGDWAPIFLSPELRDTEYGSLLNITDQLLKGWSEHGEIEYDNFPYPTPPTFPFATGLLEAAKAEMVTYNWNTKGVGYTDHSHGYETVAFGRTGALPVDYLGQRDARMREFEDRGYEYFAGATGDPNLARVVQYAAVYQVWRQFGVRAEWAPSGRSHEGPDALRPLTEVALSELRSLSPERLTDAVAESTGERKDALEELQQIHEALRGLSEGELDSLAEDLVRPREGQASALADPSRRGSVALARVIARSVFVRGFTAPLNDIARQLYLNADGKDEPDGWIKTPSIVVSRSVRQDGNGGEGGHSLSSRVTRTRVDETLAPGAVRLGEEGGEPVIFYSAADGNRLRAAVRSASRTGEDSPAAVTAAVETALRESGGDVVTMRDALRLAARPAGAARGLPQTPEIRLPPAASWARSVDVPPSHAATLKGLDDGGFLPIVIERLEGGYRVSRAGDNFAREVGDSAGALDALVDAAGRAGDRHALHLHFVGMDAAQARPFAQAGELHVGRSGPPRPLRASVESATHDAVDVIGHVRRGRWDVTRATVSVAERPGGRSLGVRVVMPEASAPKSLVLQFELSGRRAIELTEALMARIQQLVRDVLDAMAAGGQQIDAMLAARRIRKALLETEPSLSGVEMRIEVEGRELIITRHAVPTPQNPAD